MSESEPASTKADLDALKALQADISELEHVESLLDRFNVFEAIGFVGQEIKHSRFLAFLLDPRHNHGLGDHFLKRFLREASASTGKTSLPTFPEDLDEIDLAQTLVRREHRYIDILLTNEMHKLAVIIENKIWTTEHSDQLSRYYEIVKDSYPGWQVFGIYLTPYGDAPSHETYPSFGYGEVCRILDGILKDRGSTLSSDVKMSLEHYMDMLRRHIVGDSEIVRLCQQIYEKHSRALDLIYEHRLDVQPQIRSIVEGLIEQHPRLVLDNTREDNHKFGVTEWDTPALLTSAGWAGSRRILRFVFHNRPRNLDLQLALGPGPDATRQRILAMARANPDTFVIRNHRSPKWVYLYTRDFLDREAYEDLDQGEREEEIRRHWNEFLVEDLPQIDEALRNESWIWESVEPKPF